MKKLVLLPFLFSAVLLAGLVWFFINIKPVSPELSYVDFNVAPGTSAAAIGANLYKMGLIRNPSVFKVYIQFSGIANSIQAGDYRLSPSFNLFEIANQLAKAPLTVKVTIPEGLRREEVALKFTKSLSQNSVFTNEFLSFTKQDEGYLFPDTYLVANNATPASIVAKMKANFASKTDSLTPGGSNLTGDKLIILASLIERETRTDEERPVVAGIMINRLNQGMPLQIDATVQYAKGTVRCKSLSLSCQWWEPLGAGDTSFSSVYNTYQNTGLPPAPIANPGLSSIKAAYNPSKTDYLYYIHDASGQIHYARNLEEQNANINKYLR